MRQSFSCLSGALSCSCFWCPPSKFIVSFFLLFRGKGRGRMSFMFYPSHTRILWHKPAGHSPLTQPPLRRARYDLETALMLRQFVELCIPLPPPPAYHFDRDIIRHFDANDGHGTRRTCIISVLMWWFSRAVITFNVDHKVHHITIISAATSNIPQDMRYSCFFAIQSSLLPHYWSFLK